MNSLIPYYCVFGSVILFFIIILIYCKIIKTRKEYIVMQEKSLDNYNHIEILNEKLKTAETNNNYLLDLKKQQEEELKKITLELKSTKEVLDEEKAARDDLNNNFNFVASLLNAVPMVNQYFDEFTNLLNVDYVNYANKNDSLADEADALLKLQSVHKDLQLVVNCPMLYKKNIIALGGGFSCGKSSFINSLFQNKDVRLPTGVNPVTAIPAYVSSGEKSGIKGYSYTGGSIDVEKNMFKKFTHDKLKSFQFKLKSILPYLILDTVMSDDFKHICFIDTPGYNPGTDSESDMLASIEFIKQATALIWMVGVESGTLPNDDSQMLMRILEDDPDKKIFVICNKADLRDENEVSNVCMEIANQLDMLGISYEGVMPYSSNDGYDMQNPDYLSYTQKGNLVDFFKALNIENTNKAKDLILRIKSVFDKYVKADNAIIEYLRNQKTSLNKINLNIFSELEKKDE